MKETPGANAPVGLSLRARLAAIASLVVGFVVGVPALAGAQTPAPADPGSAIANMIGQTSSGIVSQFTSNLVYIVPILVLFTVAALGLRWIGARRAH